MVVSSTASHAASLLAILGKRSFAFASLAVNFVESFWNFRFSSAIFVSSYVWYTWIEPHHAWKERSRRVCSRWTLCLLDEWFLLLLRIARNRLEKKKSFFFFPHFLFVTFDFVVGSGWKNAANEHLSIASLSFFRVDLNRRFWQRNLEGRTFLPSSSWCCWATTASTDSSLMKRTKPKPRDCWVFGSTLTTTSCTSPKLEK